ncbi:MAG: prephenate dehydratase [Eubacterium sp.]|nr:prephenate dehydratase [Eubacterium sp.]
MKALNENQQACLNFYKKQRREIRRPLKNPRVAFFGTAGSYTEQAALQYFKNQGIYVAHKDSEAIFREVSEGSADYGVLPIENSTTGSILAVYDLLSRYRCCIVGETQIKVEHCLLAIPGATLDSIKEVLSHGQGFSQSKEFLAGHPQWKLLNYYNTAVAAEHVAKSQDPSLAAIASRRAAQIHHLDILAENINYSATNVTRFVVVSNALELSAARDKISIAFHLPHVAGSLYRVLGIFERHNLNLCKIESRPIPGHNWEYRFFIDFIGDIEDAKLDTVMEEVISETESFHFLGNYEQ